MATIKQVEDAIFNREGFRVKLTALSAKTGSLPPYDYEYMASNKWKLTDWRMSRLARYVPYLRSLEVFRGDGSRTVSDMRLGNLRDTYFNAFCGDEAAAFAEAAPEADPPKVTNISKARSKQR
ncbi:MAG TPA: hypothetical protein VGN11_01925 [Candidatus Baltobacteraceae bacterium]|jgi:hypothetical protein|nr:hypothetical protein [Candidatus Baltobacteraceae bacterium]